MMKLTGLRRLIPKTARAFGGHGGEKNQFGNEVTPLGNFFF